MADIDKLIRQCQKKSSKAFDELYKLYSSLIYGICLRYTKNSDEAKDLMQDCFIKILNKIGDYKFKGSFEGWIRRLTVNSAINFLKMNKELFVEDVGSYENFNGNYDPDIISNMSAQEIVKLIEQLPLGYRTIFNLHAVEGYKHVEIAEMLNISEITCRTQFKKARTALMNLIEEYGERF